MGRMGRRTRVRVESEDQSRWGCQTSHPTSIPRTIESSMAQRGSRRCGLPCKAVQPKLDGYNPSNFNTALPDNRTHPNPPAHSSGSQNCTHWKSGPITIKTSITLPTSYLSDHDFKDLPPRGRHPFLPVGAQHCKALHQLRNPGSTSHTYWCPHC